MYCTKCGRECPDTAKFCSGCGAPLGKGNATGPESPQRSTQQQASSQSEGMSGGSTTVVVNQPIKSNGIGTAGFALSLVAIFLFWVPGLNWVAWILGALFSLVGLFKVPRGLAIAGTVISFFDVIVLIFLVGGLLSLAAFSL